MAARKVDSSSKRLPEPAHSIPLTELEVQPEARHEAPLPIRRRARGLGKKRTVACVRTPKHERTRTFGMMTRDLLELADWLTQHRVTHVAMEATGVYWKPIYNLLEGYDFELLLVNPHEFKAVPGRKTDVKDAEWLADLLRHGLLRGSFVPERAQRELRELVRYRRKLIEERTREYNRLEKVLEGANIKITSVASTITGKGVRDMLRALAEGETDAERMANMARRRMRSGARGAQACARGRGRSAPAVHARRDPRPRR